MKRYDLSQRQDYLAAARIQVYVLARDRPEMLRETLCSVLSQEFVGYEVIVSDNSEGDAVGAMVQAEFPGVRYIRRRPALASPDHFGTVYHESSADYVVYFHDDDLMAPNYLGTLSAELDRDAELVAAVCNAWTIRNGMALWHGRMGWITRPWRITSAAEFLAPYLGFTRILLAAPYPGYMYRRKAIRGLYEGPVLEGGKYADVVFLLNVLALGPILCLPEPLMWYREHPGNDSATEQVGQRLKLLRFIYAHTPIDRRSALVTAYRFRYWIGWWRQIGRARRGSWRECIVRKFLIANALRMPIVQPGVWLKLAARVYRALWRGRPPKERLRDWCREVSK